MENENDIITIVPISGTVLDESTGWDLPADDIEPLNEDEEETEQSHPNFIESNTQAITLEELSKNCVVPTYADNTLTISHQNFIAAVRSAAQQVFGNLSDVEIRISHPINGRTPDALYKRKEELTPEDTTLFYQRMAFLCRVKNLTRTVNDQIVHLVIGGVRSYGEDKLYSRNSSGRFKIFVGWQVRVCSNLMLTCDGNTGTIDCLTEADIYQKSILLFNDFNTRKDATLSVLENLHNTRISEQQFVNIIGRLRIYEALEGSQRKNLPTILFGDQAANAAIHGYLSNPNFGLKEGEDSISCWQLMQIFNEAVKSSYIDRWLDRNQNATDFAIGIQKALSGDTSGLAFRWFLE